MSSVETVESSSDARKSVAVVGAGIGRSHIIEGYVPKADKFRVVAICDINPERLNALADGFKVERRVTNFDDLLRMDDLDIIDICTPPMVHYSQVIAALAAGKHVICEKPLVGSLKEVDDVINRTETAMPQARCFNAMELALRAQQLAERGTVWQQ